MNKVIDFINGKKTYIVAAGTIVYALTGHYLGYLDWPTTIDTMLVGLGLSSLRHALPPKN